MIETTGIHCKVSCNDELRRFLYTGTEFSSLRDQIKVVLGLHDKEFVLKYKDDEDDMITLSSNEELNFAIASTAQKGTLRLQAVVIDPNEKQTTGEKRPFEGCDRKQWKKKWDEKNHERNEKKCDKRKKWEDKRGEKIESRKQHLREAIEKISKIPPPSQGFDWRQKKLDHLKNKLAWLESFPADGGPSNSPNSKPPKWAALTPEQKEQVEVLKAQIRSLRSPICELKAKIHSKKSEWPDASEDRKFELSVEITKLKMEIKQLKEQIEPLKQQLSQIKH
jgi:prefoldin subunit 5